MSAISTTSKLELNHDKLRVRVECLADQLFHVEIGGTHAGESFIPSTDQVFKREYSGPSSCELLKNSIVTSNSHLKVSAGSIELFFQNELQTKIKFEKQMLTIDASRVENAYGLGQDFKRYGEMDGDWVGLKREPATEFGNGLVEFHGSIHPNIQIPILYAIGEEANFAIFMDDVSALRWDLTENHKWEVESKADVLRFYLFTGTGLRSLRRSYMELTGRPPVPPKKIFGLWISEWGYDNWQEIDNKISTLEANGFPLDGVVLDLTWFGGINGGSEMSPMGGLNWDLKNFPSPIEKIANLENEKGLGVMMIEESYVSQGLPEYKALAEKGFLAEDENGKPISLTSGTWWGLGGMIDWTNPDARKFWHDWKRQPLIDQGLVAHWTDLGEPEVYDGRAFYLGEGESKPHADVHNIYSFKWNEGIFEAYKARGLRKRPFTLSRAGAAGMQRLAATLWSADIGANYGNLRSHLNVQMHMSLSGYDYYGSDAGGFYREAFDGTDYGDLYTQWFANSCLIDIPLRVHTKNITKQYETAPDRNGSLESNRANLRLRYEMIPTYYSLAHKAWREGEPVIAPAFYYEDRDESLKAVGRQKFIGRDLMMTCVAQPNASSCEIYLPKGEWYDWHSGIKYQSEDGLMVVVPLKRENIFRLPLFARAGAIAPLMKINDKMLNAFGRDVDGNTHTALRVRLFPAQDGMENSFSLIEDDGKTIDYQDGTFLTTRINQATKNNSVLIRIDDAEGNYDGAPEHRNFEIEVASDRLPARTIVNGVKSLCKSTPEGYISISVENYPIRRPLTLELQF